MIWGVNIGARALLDINLIWFGYIARPGEERGFFTHYSNTSTPVPIFVLKMNVFSCTLFTVVSSFSGRLFMGAIYHLSSLLSYSYMQEYLKLAAAFWCRRTDALKLLSAVNAYSCIWFQVSI
jgi:hypothetical protein